MSEVTKPMALDETLQDVADALDNLTEGYAGESAYEAAVSGGYTMPQSQFEADTQAVRWRSNPNLLDNWYFVGGGDQQGAGIFPINQRKQTTYAFGQYTIDRWNNPSNSFNVNVQSDCIMIEHISGQTSTHRLWQSIENPSILNDKTVTISALYKGHIRFTADGSSNLASDVSSDTWDIKSVTFTWQNSYTLAGIRNVNGTDCWLKAIKLELGDTQTLAHQENGVWVLNEIPDYTTQLLRCQRFYRVFTSTSASTTGYGYSTNPKNLRPEMRATPSTGSFTYGGTTYYYLNANL